MTGFIDLNWTKLIKQTNMHSEICLQKHILDVADRLFLYIITSNSVDSNVTETSHFLILFDTFFIKTNWISKNRFKLE